MGKLGFSSYQKCTAAIRMLAYGISGDLVDEYVRMSESTCLVSPYNFCRAVVAVFGPEYLRQQNAADTERLLATNAARGFPGMLGNIDCTRSGRIVHLLGRASSHNGINVLQRSPVFARLAEGHSLPVNFEINGHQYNKGYYLADGIYHQWLTFVKTISNPQGEKRKRFSQMQESARKDVERAFGVLQSRWGIVRNPALTWDEGKLWEVMTACVIIHNMIVEDGRDNNIFDQGLDFQGENVEPLHQEPATFEQFTQFQRELRDWHTHLDLQNDLVEHVWTHIGNQ
ncbi:uncharacterized protein [Aegilops tauschii subsp. strangulata]|uniref:uncharacterized protein n=1 Tax=Aegilops tauschii subsp. strangulata TaxID=200361 RepID=UPI001ABC92EA|nr:uncharacterized protein LOC109787227 [Aegilops tauschii subsp. strangulata]